MDVQHNSSHAVEARRRLTDFLSNKPKVASLLSCRSAWRIDVAGATAGDQVAVTLNGCRFPYDVLPGDNEAAIAGGLQTSIESGQTSEPAESFEAFADGANLDGQGIFLWENADPFGLPSIPPPFLITTSFAASGTKSFRTDLSAGLSLTGVPTFDHIAMVQNYRGNANAIQKLSYSFRMPPGWPNYTGPDTPHIYPLTVIFFDGVIDFTYAIKTVFPFTDYTMHGETLGAPFSPGLGPFPLATIADGEWHTCDVEHDLLGTYAKFTIDGSIGGTLTTTPGPFAANLFAFFPFHDQVLTAPQSLHGISNVQFDKVQVNGEGLCLEDFLVSRLAGADESLYVRLPSVPGEELVVAIEGDLRVMAIGPVDQLQEVEDVCRDLQTKRSLADAEGTQLDGIGQIVGLTRLTGQEDSEYRALLAVQIQSNLSAGEGDRLIDIAKAFTSSTSVELREVFPGYVELRFDGATGNPSDLLSAVDGAAAGGVRVDMIQLPAGPVFALDGADGTGLDEGAFSAVVTP